MSIKKQRTKPEIGENRFLKTGEFARLSRINRNTLAFYIKKKLITPVYIGKNNYKYFAPEQIQIISLIKYLRHCMFPIESIRNILSNPDYQNFQYYLTKQKQYLEEQLDLMEEASVFIDDYKQEKIFFNSKKTEVPFIQYCKSQKVSLYPIRFCQTLNSIPDFQEYSEYINDFRRSVSYRPSVCIIPSDISNCTDFCNNVRKNNILNPIISSDHLFELKEGWYAMIIGKSCNGKLDSNLSLLRNKIKSLGYKPAEQYLYFFAENSLMNIPDLSLRRYLLKMKIETEDSKHGD